MIRRLVGLAMIIAALAPLAFGAGALLVGSSLFNFATTTATVRIERIGERIDTIDQRIADARESLAQVGAVVNALSDAVDDLAATVSGISRTLQIPALNIPDVQIDIFGVGLVDIPLPTISFPSITIPGIGSIRTILDSTLDIVEDVVTSLDDISELRLIADDMQLAFNEIDAFARDLGAVIRGNAVVLTFLCAGGIVWLVVLYLAFLGDWILRGWAMLSGRRS